MNKLKNIVLVLIGMAVSFPVLADTLKPLACKKIKTFPEVEQKIELLDKQFSFDSQDCKLVATKSLFPKKDEDGVMKFEKGLQLFIYQNNELKFICLPGWVCKAW